MPRRLSLAPRLLLTMLLLAACSSLVAAQGALLRFRWPPNQQSRYSIAETMYQSISSGGIQSELRWNRTIGFSERVVRSTPASATIERHYTALAIDVTRDAEPPVRYDSATPDPASASHPLIAPFVGLAGAKVTFTVGTTGPDTGKVTDVTGAADTLDAMLGPLARGALAKGLGAFGARPDRDAAIARQIEQGLRILPGKSVRTGDRWPIEIDHASPFAGQLASDLTGTLKGVDRSSSLATIELAGSLSLGDADEEASPLMGLLEITLDSGKIRGSVRFDEEEGRIVSSEMALETTWTVGAGLLGGEDPMKQSIRQTSTMTLKP
jgi:hypothetical protein